MPARHHANWRRQRGQVLERVAGQEEQIGAHANTNGPKFARTAQTRRRIACCRRKSLRPREAGRMEQPDFFRERETRDNHRSRRVRPGYHGYPRVSQRHCESPHPRKLPLKLRQGTRNGSPFLFADNGNARRYDVAPGDQRFGFLGTVEPTAAPGQPAMDKLVQVTNWAAEVHAKIMGKPQK